MSTTTKKKPETMETKTLIHIGNPMAEEPHRNLERAEKMHKEAPSVKLMCIVWEQSDYDALDKALDKSYSTVYLWEDDKKLLVYLLDNLTQLLGALVVGPRWYKCGDGHVNAGTYKNVLEKCETCEKPLELVEPFKEQVQKFAEVFQKALSLTNFDTGSSRYLLELVSPTKNIVNNMPYALKHKDCSRIVDTSEVKGSCKGKSAIVVGAGPSLEDALPHLKRLQERCLILCVGRAFKLLREHGIRVDYCHSVEMFDWDSAIFEDIPPVGDTILAFAAVCATTTVERWPGRKMCVWDAETAKLVGRNEFILGGNSITHHMLNFAAQILDAEEIVLVGCDLAYTKPRTHAEGTNHNWPKDVKDNDASYHEELWVPCTAKGQDFHPECHVAPAALQGGVAVGPIHVRSSPAYRDFATLFTVLITKHGKKVLNACPNGQKIEGTEFVDLATYRLDSVPV